MCVYFPPIGGICGLEVVENRGKGGEAPRAAGPPGLWKTWWKAFITFRIVALPPAIRSAFGAEAASAFLLYKPRAPDV